MDKFYSGWRNEIIESGETDSTPIDLGSAMDYVQVLLPTVDSGTIGIKVSDLEAGTYRTLGVSLTSATTTGNCAFVFILGGFQYIKIFSSASQTADRDIKVQGFKET